MSAAVIMKLGGSLCEDLDVPNCTHIVTNELKRTEKTLLGMLDRKW